MGQARQRGSFEQRCAQSQFKTQVLAAIQWYAEHPDETLTPEELAKKRKLEELLGRLAA